MYLRSTLLKNLVDYESVLELRRKMDLQTGI